MKKLIIAFALLISYQIRSVSIEFIGSLFLPTNQIMQDVYGMGWPDFAINIDHIQPFSQVEQISFFVQADYIFKEGYSLNFYENTKIQLAPVTFGVKWIQDVQDYVQLYIGAAPRYYFMHVSNDSAYVPAIIKQNGWGAYATLGAFFHPTKHCQIDFSCNYAYKKFPAPQEVENVTSFASNVSGFSLAVGLGVDF